MSAFDFVFIECTSRKSRDEQLEDAVIAMPLHHMTAAIPEIEITDDRDTLGIRRPDGEADTGHAIDGIRMCTHLVVDIIKDPGLIFPDILIGIEGRKGIGIAQLLGGAVVKGDMVTVIRGSLTGYAEGQKAGKEAAFVRKLHRNRLFPDEDKHFDGCRHIGLYEPSVLHFMRSENSLRMRCLRIRDLLDICPVHAIIQRFCHSCPPL